MNKIQIDDMSSLVNDPQNKKMYHVTNKGKVSNTNRTQTVGMLQLPDNSMNTHISSSMKVVAYFCIHDAFREVYRAVEKTCSDIVIISCENMYSEKFTIRIDYAKFSKYLIKSAFEEQARNAVFSADIKENLMNRLLFNYIRSIMKEQITEIPEKAGFYADNDSYRFVAHTDGVYETEAVKQAEYVDYRIDGIDYQRLKFKLENDSLLMMLTVLDIASFMYTPLRDNGHDFRKIIAVTGCDTREKINMFRDFFKVFERDDDDSLSLNLKPNELRNILFSRKDEAVIFEDDVSTKNRLSENVRLLYDACVRRRKIDDEKAECNCIILCSQAQTMMVLEEYANSIIWLDVSELNVCSDAVTLKQRMRNTIIQLVKSGKVISMLFDVSEYHTEIETSALLSSLHTIEIICDKVLKTVLDISSHSEKYVSDISNYAEQSGSFFDADYITSQFRNVLSNAIMQGEIAFMTGEDNISVVYVKEDLLLFTVNDFANFERKIPFGLIDRTPKTNGIRLRSILCEKGYLVTNNGDKMLYKTSISDNSTDRMNYVAIKKNILTEEAQRFVPVANKNTVSASGYEPPDNNDGIERILLGTTIDTGQPVYWSIGHDMLTNQHLYIQADTGGGKTTALILLAQRLYNAGKNVIIFDFAEKTSCSESEIRKKDESLIRSTGKSIYEGDLTEDKLIYYTVKNKCGRYEYLIYRGIDNVLYDNNDFYFSKDDFIDDMLSERRGVYILRCTPIHTAAILKDLFIYLDKNNKNRDNDIYAVLDEINSLNFDEPFSIENPQSIAEVIFRQGRGIGLNLLSATQFLVNKNSRKKAQLFNQSGTKLVMHLNSYSSTGVSKSIFIKKYEYYKNVLEKMIRGQALVYSGIECADGSITNDMPLKISISPIE